MSTAAFLWDVFLPDGEDLPRRIATDYVITEGELITVDRQEWLVERVDGNAELGGEAVVPLVYVAPPHEPAL
jgi:hypothetical protein